MNTAAEVLGRRITFRDYSEKIALLVGKAESSNKRRKQTNNHFCQGNNDLSAIAKMNLRSIIPILHTLGEHASLSQLSYVESEMSRCLNELESCSEVLRQFSEQNLSVAEQISDMFPTEYNDNLQKGNTLANEKLMVGEIEEAICSRINALIQMSSLDAISEEETETSLQSENNDEENSNTPKITNVFETEKDEESGRFISMKSLCTKLETSICGKGNNLFEGECAEDKHETKESSTSIVQKEKTETDTSVYKKDMLISGISDASTDLEQLAEAVDTEEDESIESTRHNEKYDIPPNLPVAQTNNSPNDGHITLSMNVAATALSALCKSSEENVQGTI